MTKQEEIKKDLHHIVMTCCDEVFIRRGATAELTNHILEKLHSQGVVIKVHCPDCDGDGRADKHFNRHFNNRCQKCNGWGYEAVEPLIEGGE